MRVWRCEGVKVERRALRPLQVEDGEGGERMGRTTAEKW